MMIRQLEQTSRSLEEHFGYLAETFPALLKEVRQGRHYAQATIDGLNGTSRDAGDTGSMLKAVIEGSLRRIDTIIGEIRNAGEDEQTSITTLSDEAHRISRLAFNTKDIIDKTGALELNAINSMVHAIKVGSAGGGFYHVADAMKNRTRNSLGLAKKMEETQKTLQDAGLRFMDDAAELVDKLNQIVGELDGAYRAKIEDLGKQAGTIVRDLNGLVDEADAVYAPLSSLMERIQHQDIIKQSLDQVMKLQNTMSEGRDADSIAYDHKILKISRGIIDDVQVRVRDSRDSLSGCVDEIESRIEKLGKLKQALLQRYLADTGQQTGVLHELKTYLQESNRSIISETSLLNQSNHELTGTSLALIDGYDRIYGISMNMKEVINGFWNIIMAAKIESVKQSSLSELIHTVDNMDEVTAAIGRQIDESITLAGLLTESTGNALRSHEQSISRINQVLQKLESSLAETTQDISVVIFRMIDEIADFNVFSEDFLRLFGDSRERLYGMGRVLEILDDLCSRIETRISDCENSWRQKNGSDDIDEWKLQDGQMSALINEFTVFSNKLMAGRISDVEIERNEAQEGDVTLF